MFRKKIVFLISPLFLQCFGDKKPKEESNNESSKGSDDKEKEEEKISTTTVNDANNIFSDELKMLRLEKEKCKLENDKFRAFDKKKEEARNKLKEKFPNILVQCAKKYFSRQVGGDDNNLINRLKPVLDQDVDDLNKVVKVFVRMISHSKYEVFVAEVKSIIEQYKGVLNLIENEKFDF